MSNVYRLILLCIAITGVSVWFFNNATNQFTFKPKNHNLPEEVLRMPKGFQYYWTISNEDPIFAIPGTNLKDLEKITSELLVERNLEVLASYYNSDEKELIESSLFASTYLDTLPATEAARIHFRDKPTVENLDTYHALLTQTLRSYINDVEKGANGFLSLDPLTLHLVNGTTNNVYMGEALQQVVLSAKTRLEEENDRYRCYTDFSKNCLDFSTPPIEHLEQSKSMETTAPSKDILSLDKILSELRHSNEKPSIVVIESAACYPYDNSVFYHIDKYKPFRTPGTITLVGTPINDLFFHDNSKLLDNPLYKRAYDDGIQYTYQPLNDYMCADYGLDSARIKTSLYIYKYLKYNPIFTDTKNAFPELAALEKRIVEATSTVSESEIYHFLKLAESTLSEEDISKMSNHTYEQLQELFLIWRTQTADFDLEIAALNNTIEVVNAKLLPLFEIPIRALFISRSYASSLYQLGNKTLHKNPSFLTEERKEVMYESAKIKSYRRDFKDLPLAEIKGMIKDVVEVHNGPRH